ncbi:MAG: alpha-amylase [Chloroflexota bacterium]|nr:alpha amylase N-terminal ig-like domain-containing protein [Caldilinea sp.]GIK73068.1 MAG: alpha-amylase [Chloroflexota bacterium]
MFSIRRLLHTLLVTALTLSTFLPVAPVALAQDAATIHYHRPDGDYDGWGLHVWGAAAQETAWAEPLAPAGEDDFGVFWVVPLAAGSDALGFIIHRGDEKDPGPDQFLNLATGREAWVVSAVPEVFLQPVDPNDLPTSLPTTPEPGATPSAVSFPGDYASILSGVDWQPADPVVQGSDGDGDGVWTLTVTLPGGNYEFKVAIDGAWDENYGAGGQPDGPNIRFTVPDAGGDVIFYYDRTTGAINLSVSAASGPIPLLRTARGDDAVAIAALRHDSRSDRYRVPFGAQPTNTDVTLRLRTAVNDVEQVTLLWGSVSEGVMRFTPMQSVARDDRYEWWETTVNTGAALDVLAYAFSVADGSAIVYYADDERHDGGLGRSYNAMPSSDLGWNIYVYDPAFDAPEWAKNATIYQIFPDRFRDGDPSNNPTADDWFYPDECGGHARPISPWNSLVPDPEPYDPNRNPEWYGAYNCTFFGGDLQGVQEKLEYLQELGVTTIYFNPIFDSPSNHKYDGRDYRQVDDNLAIVGDPGASNVFFAQFAAEVAERGMTLILDGVPNHSSSDSPFFDRFSRHETVGACESEQSLYRSWYFFDPARPAGTGACAGDINFRGWFNVATLPQLDTANEEVIDNWLGVEGIALQWLDLPGVEGWRIDVVPDVVNINPHFFELMRNAVKAAHPDALLISETWREDEARLRVLGDEFDSTMNYRFRSAVLGFLRDSNFEDNDGGVSALTATEFEAALRAIQEDYPPAAFATAMNLLSSHDVNRAVRVLDHDGIDFAALEPNNGFEDGRARLALAAVLQFTLPGAPTIYYGDEVGLVGFGSDVGRDDPYNRQPYPWPDADGYDGLPAWRQQDVTLLEHYQRLGQLRQQHSFLRTGSWDTLLVDDAGLVVFGRKDESGAAIIAVNRSNVDRLVSFDASGYLPWGAELRDPFSAATLIVGDLGNIAFDAPAMGYQLWMTAADVDFTTPPAPQLVATAEGNRSVTLTIQGDDSAERFAVLRSPVDGGYEEIAVLPGSDVAFDFTDAGLTNGATYFYRVVAIGYNGLRSAASDAAALTPHAVVQSVVVEEPLTLQHTLSAVEPSQETRAAVFAAGLTEITGRAPGVLMQAGWSLIDGDGEFTWIDGEYVTDNQGGGDVYAARLLPDAVGEYIVKWRASTTGGREWTESINQARMIVFPNPDAEAPRAPFRLDEVARTGALIAIGIRTSRTADLHAFRICRADLTAGEEGCAVRVDIPKTMSIYTDTTVTTGHTYVYTVQSVDTAFNVSDPSPAITLTAELSMVDVTWRVLTPAETPPNDTIFIAGDNVDAFLAPYNPSLTPMTPADERHWEFTATLKEGTRLQYKYTRGSWETVEQWGTISGFGNRHLTVVKGADGTMLVEDTATDWGGDGPDDRRAIQFWRDPLVTAASPAPDSSGPAPDAITVEFSILVSPVGGDLAQVITVVDGDGDPVPGAVTQSSGRSFTFTPAALLSAGEYTVTVFNVEQTTPMVAPYTWSFVVSE